MMTKALKDAMERVETWPEDAREEFVAMTLEIDATLSGDVYHATEQELQTIDEADRSGVASEKEVVAAFRAFRRA